MRQIRQKKAAGGFVPQSFINDILEANINTAAGRAAGERQLSMQEERDKTQKEQYATSLEENKRQFSENQAEADKNRQLTEEQIEGQGMANIASLAVQAPLAYMAGKSLFGKTATEKAAGSVATNMAPPSSGVSPIAPTASPAPWLPDTAYGGDWAATEAAMGGEGAFMPEMFTGGTPAAPGVSSGMSSPGVAAGSDSLMTPGNAAAAYAATRIAGKLGKNLDLPGQTLWSAMEQPATGVLKEAGNFLGIKELGEPARIEEQIVGGVEDFLGSTVKKVLSPITGGK